MTIRNPDLRGAPVTPTQEAPDRAAYRADPDRQARIAELAAEMERRGLAFRPHAVATARWNAANREKMREYTRAWRARKRAQESALPGEDGRGLGR